MLIDVKLNGNCYVEVGQSKLHVSFQMTFLFGHPDVSR